MAPIYQAAYALNQNMIKTVQAIQIKGKEFGFFINGRNSILTVKIFSQ